MTRTDSGEAFALGRFLGRHQAAIRHDLGASGCETMGLPALLGMADAEDRARWSALDFGYTHPQGSETLRAAIAARHATIAPGDVLCCAGAQEALHCIMRALLGPHDHAIVVVPIYQPSEWSVTRCCAASGVALEEHAQGWRLDVGRIAACIRPHTKVVLTNFPNSPTGACIDAATLADLVGLCRRHGLWLVNDEVYRLVGHDAAHKPRPVADLYERGISVDALSKGFGLPGLRTGWIACRDRVALAAAMEAKSALSSCLASPSEVLAQVALACESAIVARNRSIADANWSLLLPVLDRHRDRLEAPPAAGGVLAFPRYVGPGCAADFASGLVLGHGVLVMPQALWHTPLAPLADDHVRIGLGAAACPAAIDALDRALGQAG